MANILLLSAYDAQSHQYWRTGLVGMFPEHQWQVLTLPARFFSWRVRGNGLSWAYGEKETLSKPYDLIICTSMTDLSALIGLCPSLANVPSLIYFHENQFAYPLSGHEFSSVEPQIVSIYAALASTKVLFNSAFNRDTFLNGVNALLNKLPDQVPKGLMNILTEKSSVVSVPLKELSVPINLSSASDDKLQIIWNHRWEFDKGPALLLKALRALKQKSSDFIIHIVGQRFTKIPDEFNQLKHEFIDNIGRWGFIEDIDDYYALLSRSDVVLSTALHDFQGLSILEGMQLGCVPLVPERLAYPEFIPDAYRYLVCDERQKEIKEAEVIANSLFEYIKIKDKERLVQNEQAKYVVKQLSWHVMREHYQHAITDCLQSGTC